MSIIVYSTSGGLVKKGEWVFENDCALMFSPAVHVAHMYRPRLGDLCVVLDSPSLDFLTGEMTRTAEGDQLSVWIRPATADEVAERLFIQEDGDAGLSDMPTTRFGRARPFPKIAFDPQGVLRPEPPDVISSTPDYAAEESEAAT